MLTRCRTDTCPGTPAETLTLVFADGTLIERGTKLVQTDLANTLDQISKNGPRAFYEGPVADKIAAAVRSAGGLMTTDDLKDYKAVERPVLLGALDLVLEEHLLGDDVPADERDEDQREEQQAGAEQSS